MPPSIARNQWHSLVPVSVIPEVTQQKPRVTNKVRAGAWVFYDVAFGDDPLTMWTAANREKDWKVLLYFNGHELARTNKWRLAVIEACKTYRERA